MRIVTAFVLLLGAGLGAGPAHPPDRLESLSWMAGCWQAGSGDRSVEEQWMRPRAGSMLGMSRTIRGDSTVAYELMRIVVRDGRVFFVAQPSGQSAAEFVAGEVEEGSVDFTNPEHDFPQRITYRRVGEDSLIARIEGVLSGRERGADFRYARVSCS